MNRSMRTAVTMVAVAMIQAGLALGETANDIRQGPKQLKPSHHGVGRMLPDLSFIDIDGAQHTLSDYRDHKAVVIAMTGTGCPLCLKYAPTLAAIETQYRDRDVAFVFVNPNESEKIARLRDAVGTHGFDGPYVVDAKKVLPRALGATTTTEVFVMDRARTLVYRGAVDDQYGFGYTLDAPVNHYLTEALDAVLSGQTPRVAATTSPGCELSYADSGGDAEPSTVTYHNRVSRMMQANCIECHREDGIAPIALESYEEVRDYMAMIRSVIDRGIMPPWFAAPLAGDENTENAAPHWANERSLSDSEKADLFAWIESGAPEGDPGDAPLRRQFPDGWLIGKPDAVFEFPHPQPVKATGTMPYKTVTVDTNLAEGKWVRAIEIRPGNPSVVHHVIVSLRSEDGDERSGYWGVYVPGNSTLDYPEGFAKWLPKDAKLRFQMHYTPNGTATEDSTRIGLVFAEQPPKHEVKVTGISNARFSIPAGADNHPETASISIPQDVQILGFLPHMHLRGKAARYELVNSAGTEVLLDVPRYDFNWQLCYQLAEPRTLTRGDTIRYTSWYDNSADNPANPDPTRTVTWGQQTEDEMHLGYVEYIVTNEKPGEAKSSVSASDSGRGRGASGAKLFRRLDVNGDGFITRPEVRERVPDDDNAAGSTFDRLDVDKNDKLDQAELSRF